MHFCLGLFLVVVTAASIAQQYSTPNAVQPSSSEAPDPTLTSSAGASLPDAPSSATRQQSTSTPRSPVPMQFLKPPTPNSIASSQLVFFGGPSIGIEADRSPQQFVSAGGGSGGNCVSTSSEKPDGGGWFNALLSATSKSGHYCALGEGSFWKRGTYAMGRAFAAHKYDNANSFTNPAEFFAPGTTTASANYNRYQAYAYRYDAGERLATRYATAVGRDTLKNMIREFWPDISGHVLKRRP